MGKITHERSVLTISAYLNYMFFNNQVVFHRMYLKRQFYQAYTMKIRNTKYRNRWGNTIYICTNCITVLQYIIILNNKFFDLYAVFHSRIFKTRNLPSLYKESTNHINYRNEWDNKTHNYFQKYFAKIPHNK